MVMLFMSSNLYRTAGNSTGRAGAVPVPFRVCEREDVDDAGGVDEAVMWGGIEAPLVSGPMSRA
jgi:hypothetical protein